MKSLKAIKNSYSILTICLILVGAVLLIWPHMALGAICKMCGIFLIIFGLVKLTGYFSKDIFQLAFQYDLGLGIASIIFGLIMVIRSWATIQLFSICIGIFLLIDAALKMQTAFESKKFGFRNWWVTLLIAIIVCILGILLFAMPFQTSGVITRLIGINLILDGALNLFVVQSTVRTIKRKEDEMIIDEDDFLN